jgi:hypothetical protein
MNRDSCFPMAEQGYGHGQGKEKCMMNGKVMMFH